jgi:uncharacterized membrane protein YidH (DUF202 family)
MGNGIEFQMATAHCTDNAISKYSHPSTHIAWHRTACGLHRHQNGIGIRQVRHELIKDFHK